MAVRGQTTSWIEPVTRRPDAVCRLFCFPYAGGSAAVFRGWPSSLPDGIDISPIQLPGRASRLREQAYTCFTDLIPALADNLSDAFDLPFVFFGHSMGAVIAFELARWLRRTCGIEPLHVFVSGASAPHVRDAVSRTYDLPDAEFVEELRRLNGTPEEILNNPDAIALLLPLLRADFQLVQTYIYRDERPLRCPITGFGGADDDSVPEAAVREWERQTAGGFKCVTMPGDHFFLNTSPAPLLATLRFELSAIEARVRAAYPFRAPTRRDAVRAFAYRGGPS